MDQTKKVSICQFNRLCKWINFTYDGTVEEMNEVNDLFEIRSSFFRILLPIILVFGVLIAIAMIFMAQRITFELFEKRRNARANPRRASMQSSNGTPASRGTRREISSISSHINSLPTYMQVMESIRKNKGPPPSYGEVTKTTFAKNSISNPQQPTADLNRQQTLPRPAFSSTSSFDFLPETSLNGTGMNYSGSNSGSGSGSAGARLTLNQARDEQVSIIIYDIDELVNSISVSTSLNQQSNEINDETLITGREDLLNDVDGIQTIDMTNQRPIVRVDSPSSLNSTSI